MTTTTTNGTSTTDANKTRMFLRNFWPEFSPFRLLTYADEFGITEEELLQLIIEDHHERILKTYTMAREDADEEAHDGVSRWMSPAGLYHQGDDAVDAMAQMEQMLDRRVMEQEG